MESILIMNGFIFVPNCRTSNISALTDYEVSFPNCVAVILIILKAHFFEFGQLEFIPLNVYGTQIRTKRPFVSFLIPCFAQFTCANITKPLYVPRMIHLTGI